jgi:hypothetical protein
LTCQGITGSHPWDCPHADFQCLYGAPAKGQEGQRLFGPRAYSCSDSVMTGVTMKL